MTSAPLPDAGANWGAPLAEFPDSAWDKVLALNLKGVFHLTRACLPQLAAAATPADPARVINIGSIDGIRVPVVETYAYSSSKAALHHLTRVLAVRLAPQHITVNAVAPGPFESKMMHETLERYRDHILSSCPLGRIGARGKREGRDGRQPFASRDHQFSARTTIWSFSAKACFSDFFGFTLTP